MSKVVFCCECAARAPMADTSYTVIGAGWRVSRRQTPEGMVIEWRCRDCWRKHKTGEKGASSGAFPATPGPRPRPPRDE